MQFYFSKSKMQIINLLMIQQFKKNNVFYRINLKDSPGFILVLMLILVLETIVTA